jgi:predicted negative regulator of RcsB-dependent stress response
VDEYLSEKEQLEWLRGLAREYGPWAVAGLAVGALAIGGWMWWQNRTDRLAQDASARYEQILRTFDAGDRTRALTLIEDLKREHPQSPYLDQANLAAARVLVESNELPQAADHLRGVMQNARDPVLVMVARLRLARVQTALGKPDEALATLGAAPAGAFAASYDEARGDAYLAKADKAAALREYRAARTAAGPALAAGDTLGLKINDLTSEGDGAHVATAGGH